MSGTLKALSEPVLGDEDVNVDNVTMRYHSTHDIVHLQFQDGMERSNNGSHLAHHACRDRERLLRLTGIKWAFMSYRTCFVPAREKLPFIFDIAERKLPTGSVNSFQESLQCKNKIKSFVQNALQKVQK